MTNTACEPGHLPYLCSNLLLNTHSTKNYTTDSTSQEKCKHAIPKAADAGNVKEWKESNMFLCGSNKQTE